LNLTQLANKIEWEGSVAEAIEYGVKWSDIEDEKVANLWRLAEAAYREFNGFAVLIEKDLEGFAE